MAQSLSNCAGDALDPEGYLDANLDVKAAGVDACSHYSSHGKREGRSPNPKNIQNQNQSRSDGLTNCSGDLFDPNGYLTANRDVRDAGVTDACSHYLSHGKSEGRNPNPYNLQNQNSNNGLINCNGDLFDPEGYLGANSDVRNAGVDACLHYTSHGKIEGRSPDPRNRGGQNPVIPPVVPPVIPPVTPPGGQSGSGELLNSASDWNQFLPTSVGEVWFITPNTSDTIEYHHATHSILNVQTAYDGGLRAIGYLKVQGKSSGIVYAESIQKQGAIRSDMNGENKFGNNHPMNIYGVGLGRDSVLRLPKNEVLVFTWTNRGSAKIMADLIHPNPDPSKNVNFKQCLNPGETAIFEYHPAHYNDLKEWHQVIKSNMNAYQECY